MLEILLMPFAIKAFIFGIIISIICSITGIFIVSKNMAYFSESISHSSLTAIAIAIWLKLNPHFFLIVFSLILATIIAYLINSTLTSRDSIIGIIHSSSMALGIVLFSLFQGGSTDITRYLFGDILTITNYDILMCLILFLITSLYFFKFTKINILNLVIPHLSILNGINVKKYDFILMLVIALIISISIKIAGALLITAMLIIPPNSAKNISNKFSTFLIFSILFGISCSIIGIVFSFLFDIPTGPSIVLVNALLYFCTLQYKNKIKTNTYI